MGHYLSLPLLFLAVVIQTTFIPQIRVFGGQPDLLLLFVLSWSVHERLEVNVTWAFVAGIAADLMSAAPTGVSVIGLLCIVFLIDQLKGQLFNISLPVLVLLTAFSTLIQQTLFLMLMSINGANVRLVEQVFYVMLPSMVYNILVILPVYWFIRRIQRTFFERRRIARRITLSAR